jgi:hypothetical protein
MFIKHLIDPARMRKAPPRGFGWIDHRLLRDGHIGCASVEALALYLLLVCASDAEGLSFYSDARSAQLLGLVPAAVASARAELLRLGLILYRKPVYQLLGMAEEAAFAEPCRRSPCAPLPRRQTPAAPPSLPPVAADETRRVFPLRAAVEKLLSQGGAA